MGIFAFSQSWNPDSEEHLLVWARGGHASMHVNEEYIIFWTIQEGGFGPGFTNSKQSSFSSSCDTVCFFPLQAIFHNWGKNRSIWVLVLRRIVINISVSQRCFVMFPRFNNYESPKARFFFTTMFLSFGKASSRWPIFEIYDHWNKSMLSPPPPRRKFISENTRKTNKVHQTTTVLQKNDPKPRKFIFYAHRLMEI